ncbi:MAG: hypothetical protein MZV65_44610 [Chromatiales bacterium]|nr:hypothetical protein [Chromatiales bacterium]
MGANLVLETAARAAGAARPACRSSPTRCARRRHRKPARASAPMPNWPSRWRVMPRAISPTTYDRTLAVAGGARARALQHLV